MSTLIIGGGLSGLAIAEALETRGADYMLLESRERFGGRIMTEDFAGASFDMGPAWFWPGQPRIEALVRRFGLVAFEQYSKGILTFEDETGQLQRGRGHASMQGSWRLEGGLSALTTKLSDRIPRTRKRLNAQVAGLARDNDRLTATLKSGETFTADRAILAMPPRVAAQIDFAPYLPEQTLHAMQSVPTWMAGQAKAVAVYDSPFWRDAGLSGDAMSRVGPLVEVHDASPDQGGPYALFGFIGLPPKDRQNTPVLRDEICAQLGRLFGPAAAKPDKLFIKDWAFDANTSTKADFAPLYAHPTYILPAVMRDVWDGRIQFAGTEVAPAFGGYLEGALEAAENVLKRCFT
jgi:monoamine oxidase